MSIRHPTITYPRAYRYNHANDGRRGEKDGCEDQADSSEVQKPGKEGPQTRSEEQRKVVYRDRSAAGIVSEG